MVYEGRMTSMKLMKTGKRSIVIMLAVCALSIAPGAVHLRMAPIIKATIRVRVEKFIVHTTISIITRKQIVKSIVHSIRKHTAMGKSIV